MSHGFKRLTRKERTYLVLEGFASGIIFAALVMGWLVFALAW